MDWKKKYQRPEGRLIETATSLGPLSTRQASARAGLGTSRWRELVNGYKIVGSGQAVEAVAPADRLARMARAVGVTAEQLRHAGRDDAADVLTMMAGVEAEQQHLDDAPLASRLERLRDDLNQIIAEVSDGREA